MNKVSFTKNKGRKRPGPHSPKNWETLLLYCMYPVEDVCPKEQNCCRRSSARDTDHWLKEKILHLGMRTKQPGVTPGSLARGLPPTSLLALLKYPFYPLFNFDNGMNLISESLTILTSSQLLVVFAFAHIFWRYFVFAGF